MSTLSPVLERAPAPTPAAPGWMPGLDGLRAVAVVLVVAFHARVLPGGFIGVSVFFTLSGFLITIRSLDRLEREGRFRPLEFTTARLRRLAPAALAAIALGIATTMAIGGAERLADLRSQALWAASYVQNWKSAGTPGGYAAMFETPNPFEHFWSLAVEEQFYLAFPLIMLAVVRWGRRRAALLVGLAGAGSIAVALGGGLTPARLYFGTDARAWELLAGVLMGLLWHGLRPALSQLGRRLTVLRWAAVATLLTAAASITVASPWVEQGRLVFWPLLSAPLVAVVACRPGRLLTAAPVRRVGVLAYGIYLVHWPLQILADHLLPAAAATTRFGLVLAASILLAEVSLRAIEQPIRQWDRPREAAMRFGVVAAAAAIAVLAIPTVDEGDRIQLPELAAGAGVQLGLAPGAAAPRVLGITTEAPTTSPTTAAPTTATPTTAAPTTSPTSTSAAPTTTVAPPPEVHWAIVGDSGALTLAIDEARHRGETSPARVHGDRTMVQRWGDAVMGCGIARNGAAINPRCLDRWQGGLQEVAESGPGVLILLAPGHWELDHLLVDGRLLTLDDPAAVLWLRSEYLDAVNLLRSRGSAVALITNPPMRADACAARRAKGEECDFETRNRRLGVVNDVLREVGRSAGAPVIELGAWVAENDHAALQPDSVHWTPASATATWERFLAAEVIRTYDAIHR